MNSQSVLNRASDDGTVAGLARAILEPLCEETAQLLRPARLSDADRLKVSLNEDGSKFVVHAYGHHVPKPDPQIQKVRELMARGDVTDAGARGMLEAFSCITIPAGKTVAEWLADEERERQERASFIDASWNAKQKWQQNVPEREDIGKNRWELAATDITSLIINANWPDDKVVWDAEARALHMLNLSRFMKQTLNSHHRANYKVNKKVPELASDWVDHPERPLADYQRVACHCTIDEEGAALFMEQGTGKTAPTIQRIMIQAHRHYQRECIAAAVDGRKRQLYRAIIVCPKNVRFNWQKEMEAFATRPGKVTVLRGGQLNRMKLLLETIATDDEDSEYAMIVCSYETVKRSWDIIRMMPWNLAVLDESHMIKSRRADRGQTMLQLRNISEERMILTGTPVCNSLMDLYMQLEFLGEGMSGFSSWEKFKSFYGSYERAGNSQHEKLVGYQNLPFLKERLARIAFQITKREALPNLPAKLDRVVEVEMSKKQRDAYIKLQTQLALEIEDGSKKMLAQHILVKLLRLAQITSGFMAWDATVDPETGDVTGARSIEYFDPIPKVEAIVEDIKSYGEDEKVIIWACFRPDIAALTARLKREGIPYVEFTGSTSDEDRQEAERRFNQLHARECKVFVGNPAAGGTGLNLRGYDPSTEDHGCNCTQVGYMSQGWSMVHRNQSADRAHRRGTRLPVTYTDYVVPGTIDEEIRLRVLGKTMNANEIQDVREIMKRVLETIPDEED